MSPTRSRAALSLAAALAAILGCSGCFAPALGALGAVAGGAAAGGAVVAGTAAVAGTGAAVAGATTAMVGTSAAVAGTVVGTTAVAAGTGAAVAGGTAAAAGTAGVVGGTAAMGTTIGATGVTMVSAVAGTQVAMVGGSAAAVGGAALTGPIVEAQALVQTSGVAASASASSAALAISAHTVFVPNEILVTNLGAAGLAVVKARGFRVVEAGTLRQLALTTARLQPPHGLSLEAALALLAKADPAAQYERNPIYRLAGAASDCQGLRCYPQTLVGWPRRCGLTLRLGLLDGALDLRHPALAGRRIETRRFAPGAATAGEQDHATAIAALLAGAADGPFPGLLPNAELVAADVFSRDASGAPYTDAARLAAGLDWLASRNPDVVNISLAGPDSALLHTAVRRLVQSGVGVVAAVGNLGPRAPRQYPAAYPEAVAVTAVDRNLKLYALANAGEYVTLAAPGVGVWTAAANGAGQFRDGTSFAAPFVAAAFSVEKARHPDLAPLGVVERLRRGAKPIPAANASLLQAPSCQ